MSKQPIIVLTGPTAVGKTALSIKLAKDINGSIISADSMQVYKYMDVGSAKITKDEMDGVKHYLIDILDPKDEFNIFLFKKYAKEAMEDIYSKGKIPIVAGGTGFYIQSLIYDIDFTEDEDNSEIREKYENILQEKGKEYLYELLKQVDIKSTENIHMNNTKRVIRALEYYEINKSPISKHNEEESLKDSPYNFEYFVLTKNREKLYNDIDRRVDIMLDNGLVDEVIRLKDMGLSRDNISMQGIGYKEILDYLDGKTSLEEAVYIIKRDTRHFAKRQLTWFRREKKVTFIDKDIYKDENEILKHMKEILVKDGIIQ